ncbi:hypothetical protein B0T22DRAFT_456577 [Podospora appendiculata]|uniref:NAD(P)-binding protein n=1 Tax=Podospora appendiculata TaxID=314037 RepID=A0AAE0X6Y3_9PEZI|nr:hypothetical protein B0T22DRAFT_456577 [Podospora appendiculata]
MPVYCITGANRGLGLEFVRQLAQSPSNVVLALTRSLSSDLTDLKAAASANTHILECDVSDLLSIHHCSKEVALTLGATSKIDYLINNAGVNIASSQNSLNLGPDELMAQIKTNVLGPAKTVEFLLMAGVLAENARILNMSSGLGSIQSSLASPKCTGYSISKAALDMLTVHQSNDLKEKLPGVVVIAMDPGWVRTRLGGEGALLTTQESIEGVLKVLHSLKVEDNSKFYQYNGEQVPW